MSKTIDIPDEVYSRLEAEAARRGLGDVVQLLEAVSSAVPNVQRSSVFDEIHVFRERLRAKYGTFPDSVELIREDRER